MTARCAGSGSGSGLRLVRRAAVAPYPLARSAAPPPPPLPLPLPLPDRAHTEVRRARIPQQHTGSSVHSVQSAHGALGALGPQVALGAPGGPGAQGPRRPAGARSASPRERKGGLARQILHNLNIFSNTNSKQAPEPEPAEEGEGEGEGEREGEGRVGDECSSRSGRRHSVDTVSTYLSHESKDSLQQGSVGELLNCSAGSDEVFEAGEGEEAGEAGLDSEVGAWARAVARPQWGALCPACLRALEGSEPVVALQRCQHMLHLHCLRRQLRARAHNQEPLYIECLVCGQVYGPGRHQAPPPRPLTEGPLAEGPIEGPLIEGPRSEGPQPAGSMAWCLQPTALPQHPPCTNSILVTYNFQSGRQGSRHPSPGAAYYAVGFPRHSVLPDSALGRQVLALLVAAWERGLLFTVCASQTTGREHVVAWRATPPPATPHHYRPPAEPHALLAAAGARLHALLH